MATDIATNDIDQPQCKIVNDTFSCCEFVSQIPVPKFVLLKYQLND